MSRLTRLVKSVIPRPTIDRLRGILFSLRNRGFDPYVGAVELDNLELQFLVGDRVGEEWYESGWDWAEMRYIRDHIVREGDVVIECGAHHGEMTIFLSNWVGPAGSVIVFEPVRRNVDIIRANLKLNGIDNVEVHNAAVGAENGSAFITNESNAVVAASDTGERVPVIMLDEFAVFNPTVLKIDVEGYETEVLRGAPIILGRRPRIALEVHTNRLKEYGTSVEEVLSFLDRGDYKMWVQHRGRQDVVPFKSGPLRETAHIFAIPVG